MGTSGGLQSNPLPGAVSDQIAQGSIPWGLETLQEGRWHHLPGPGRTEGKRLSLKTILNLSSLSWCGCLSRSCQAPLWWACHHPLDLLPGGTGVSLQQSHSFVAACGAPGPAGCFPSVCICVRALGREPFTCNTLLEVSCSCHPAPYAFQANCSVLFMSFMTFMCFSCASFFSNASTVLWRGSVWLSVYQRYSASLSAGGNIPVTWLLGLLFSVSCSSLSSILCLALGSLKFPNLSGGAWPSMFTPMIWPTMTQAVSSFAAMLFSRPRKAMKLMHPCITLEESSLSMTLRLEVK